MKKIILILIAILFVAACKPIEPGKAAPGVNFLEDILGEADTCFDSDNTKLMPNDQSYFVNGYVTSLEIVFNDLCEDGILREYYCEKGEVRSVKIECSYGCGAGAFCKKQIT